MTYTEGTLHLLERLIRSVRQEKNMSVARPGKTYVFEPDTCEKSLNRILEGHGLTENAILHTLKEEQERRKND